MGAALVDRLATDLTDRFSRGFGRRNLFQMRAFYLAYREIPKTASAQSKGLPGAAIVQTASALFTTMARASGRADVPTFPLPWSHYVRLLGVRSAEARRFYEAEALRGGWTIRCYQAKWLMGSRAGWLMGRKKSQSGQAR